MKIAVTGVSGQLGSVLLHDLPPHGHEVFPLDKNIFNFLNFELSKTHLDQLRPDLVINCAAFTHVDLAETKVEEAHLINASGPTQLAKYCREKGIRLLHLSTDSVFSTVTPIMNPVFGSTNPVNVYAKSKLAGEIGIQTEHPKGSIIVRTAWLYGNNGAKFVQAIISKGIKNLPFEVVNDQFGQPTHTQSLSNFICFLLNSDVASGIFHFSSKDFLSRFELAQEILTMASLDKELVMPTPTIPTAGIAQRPKYSLLDTNPESVYNYPKVPDWKTDLEEFLREYNLPNG